MVIGCLHPCWCFQYHIQCSLNDHVTLFVCISWQPDSLIRNSPATRDIQVSHNKKRTAWQELGHSHLLLGNAPILSPFVNKPWFITRISHHILRTQLSFTNSQSAISRWYHLALVLWNTVVTRRTAFVWFGNHFVPKAVLRCKLCTVEFCSAGHLIVDTGAPCAGIRLPMDVKPLKYNTPLKKTLAGFTREAALSGRGDGIGT